MENSKRSKEKIHTISASLTALLEFIDASGLVAAASLKLLKLRIDLMGVLPGGGNSGAAGGAAVLSDLEAFLDIDLRAAAWVIDRSLAPSS